MTITKKFDIIGNVSTTNFTLEVYFYDESIDDAGISIDLEVELKCRKDDAGIGSYDFWGARGFDSQPYWEVDEITLDGIPEEYKELTESLTEKICELVRELDV